MENIDYVLLENWGFCITTLKRMSLRNLQIYKHMFINNED